MALTGQANLVLLDEGHGVLIAVVARQIDSRTSGGGSGLHRDAESVAAPM